MTYQVYIASSWKNQHAVEMLTDILELKNIEVISFVRKACKDETRAKLKFDVDAWINSEDGEKKFKYDLNGATESHAVIYISPSGNDAWAEVGAAYQSGVKIFGLYAKGETSGLMRRMVTWYNDYQSLLMDLFKYLHII